MNATATLTSRRPAPGRVLVRAAVVAPCAVLRLLPWQLICAHMTTMRIVGHRVEGARRRIPFQALFAEARAPQGSGPFCFALFFGFQCLR